MPRGAGDRLKVNDHRLEHSLSTDSRQALKCTIPEEFTNLAALEAECLVVMNRPLTSGKEWFRADIEHAKKVIEETLTDNALTYFVES
jgi:hypothetical protein